LRKAFRRFAGGTQSARSETTGQRLLGKDTIVLDTAFAGRTPTVRKKRFNKTLKRLAGETRFRQRLILWQKAVKSG
jgi:hypothetical protein